MCWGEMTRMRSNPLGRSRKSVMAHERRIPSSDASMAGSSTQGAAVLRMALGSSTSPCTMASMMALMVLPESGPAICGSTTNDCSISSSVQP